MKSNKKFKSRTGQKTEKLSSQIKKSQRKEKKSCSIQEFD